MDVNLISQYQLIIKITDTGIVFLVCDTESNKCLALEKYKFPVSATLENISISLQNIWDAHPYLNAGYWKKVVLLFSNLKFTFVPIPLKENDISAEAFTHLNFKLAPQEQIYSYRINSLDADCYFGVNQEVIKWFSELYPSMVTKIGHSTCAFLKGLQQQDTKANQLHIYTAESLVTLANLKEGRLNYLNSFPRQSEDDILYTCTLVVDELNLDRKDVEINFWSESDDNAVILEKLRMYYPSINVGKRPAHLSYSFEFDEVEESSYFDLFHATELFV
jgi:hypothetical protein